MHGDGKIAVDQEALPQHGIRPGAEARFRFVGQNVGVRPAGNDVEHRAVSAQSFGIEIGFADFGAEAAQIDKFGEIVQIVASDGFGNAPKRPPMGMDRVFGDEGYKPSVPAQIGLVSGFYGGEIAQGALPALKVGGKDGGGKGVGDMRVAVFTIDGRPCGHRQSGIFPRNRGAAAVDVEQQEGTQMRRIDLDIAVLDGAGVASDAVWRVFVVLAVGLVRDARLQEQIGLVKLVHGRLLGREQGLL